jgi:hypothetical protein
MDIDILLRYTLSFAICFTIVVFIAIFYSIVVIGPKQDAELKSFYQSCDNKHGVVLKNTAKFSKAKYVCVKEEMILE